MTTTFNNKMSDSPINLEELKSKLILEHANAETKRSGFPTEIISLPSKGLLYPEGSPLRQGKIEMKYKEYRILRKTEHQEMYIADAPHSMEPPQCSSICSVTPNTRNTITSLFDQVSL